MTWLSDVYVSVAMNIVKLFVYAYEYLTLPVYFLFSKTQYFMPFPEEEDSFIQKFNAEQSRTMSLCVRDGDPGSAWRAVEYIDNLATVAMPGCNTLPELWLRSVQLYPNKPVLGTREILKSDYEIDQNGKKLLKFTLGDYYWETLEEAERRTSLLAAAIRELLGPSTFDKTPTIIFSETQAEWHYAAQASFRLNRPVATLYATLGDEAIIHGLEQTEASIVFTSVELLPKLVNLLNNCPRVKYVVYFSQGIFKNRSGGDINDLQRFHCIARLGIEQSRKDVPSNVKLLDILELEQIGKAAIDEASGRVDDSNVAYKNWQPPSIERPKADDLAVIMYTSGSTGQPKGVEIIHSNITCAVAGYFRRLPKLHPEGDIYIGYLPLAHVLELICEISILIMGIQIGYSHPQTLTDTSTRINIAACKGDITVLKPTLFVCVPAILERISKAVWEKLKEGGALTEAIFRFAYEYKRRRLHTGFPSFLVDLLIFRKVRALMGGRIRCLLSGGAPLSEESQLFTNICFGPIMQGYGLTETCAAATLSECGDLRCNHVGAPTPCIQLKLREWAEAGYSPYDKPSPRGEILISGGSVSRGYYKNPEETANAYFTDSDGVRWFCTGDIGLVHEDGSFSIIDRKKDLVKLQGGEYVSLVKVELAVSQSVYVENACIYADPNHYYAVGFISPKLSQMRKLASELGILQSIEDQVKSSLPADIFEDSHAVALAEHRLICETNQVRDFILRDIQQICRAKKLASFEIPSKIYLDPDAWTPDTGLVTDALKLKRFNIKSKFLTEIDRMYSQIDKS